MKVKRRWLVLRVVGMMAITLFYWLSLPLNTLAIAAPDDVSLDGITLFNSLISDNDTLAIVPYSITFTTEPTQKIDQTFIFSMRSADNSTEYGSVLAYPYYNGGYGSGVVSFYFESGITWGSSYSFRLQENPTYYPSGQYWDFQIGASNYSSATDQTAALKTEITDSATFLTTQYSIALLTTNEGGATVLSTDGELYYVEAIPGLQTMCPALFSVRLESPDYTKRSWSTAFAELMQTKYSGTFIGDFMTGWAGQFSMEQNAAAAILSIILFAVLIAIDVAKMKATMLSAFVDGYAFLLLLMLMGMFPMLAAGGIAFCSTVIGGIILFLNRA